MRTSETDPLEIDICQNGLGYGYIGMTICPGKKGTSSFGSTWDRDLDTDIQRLIDEHCHGVLTILEQDEMEMLSVRDLDKQMQRAGLRWWHLSVPDGGVLSSDRYPEWEEIRRSILSFLIAGSNLVIHCRGGLGRTGTFAAVLLMDLLNISPKEATKRVRFVRKGTIERSCQEEFIRNYHKLVSGGY